MEAITTPTINRGRKPRTNNSVGGDLHLSLVLGLGGIRVSGDLGNNISSVEGALGVLGNVGVVRFGLHAASLDYVLVGSGWVATVASSIGLVTVNNLAKQRVSIHANGKGINISPVGEQGRQGGCQQEPRQTRCSQWWRKPSMSRTAPGS